MKYTGKKRYVIPSIQHAQDFYVFVGMRKYIVLEGHEKKKQKSEQGEGIPRGGRRHTDCEDKIVY